ncbi:DinB family protein [Clavibacter tessellarius]|uniref:DinB family protein n=1 Tax=Clavibacter tessellarius TaxID=31965 RepID=UPI0032544B84
MGGRSSGRAPDPRRSHDPAIDLLVDAYGRIGEIVHDAVDGLDADDLAYRPDDEANTVGWLVWHLARVQDAQVADVAGGTAVLDRGRMGGALRPPVRRVRHRIRAVAGGRRRPRGTGPELLLGYLDAVQAATLAYLAGLGEPEPRARGGRGLDAAGHASPPAS